MKQLAWIPALLLAGGLAAGLAPGRQAGGEAGGAGDAEGKRGRPDREMGLTGASVFETTVPPAAPREDRSPGEGEHVPVPHPGAPPVIPHAVADFLPVTRQDNACLLCHGDPDMGAPVMPESHYVDLRNAPGKVREEIAGARQVCLSCHVVQTGARPLVGNRFGEARR